MKTFYVYIIECSDSSYYTGVTNDLERRLYEHNEGETSNSYTAKRRPVTLKFVATFWDPMQAFAFEKQIKGWSRKKKEALFNEDWELIKYYSNKKKE